MDIMNYKGGIVNMKKDCPLEPLTPCIHLSELIDILSELDISLNDGYADWFNCIKHNQDIRIENEGIMGFRYKNIYYHRSYNDEWIEEKE